MNLEWHLKGAKAELDSAHAAALIEDGVFAHEVAQFVFATGALLEAWQRRKGRSVERGSVERGNGTDPSPQPSPLKAGEREIQTSGPDDREQSLSCGGQPE